MSGFRPPSSPDRSLHRQRVELTPATSYQRLLVHRCSAYYKLSPENDPLAKGTIFVLITQDSRMYVLVPPCHLNFPPDHSSQS